eukprot:gnl/TRDRNA2_/TRDRNA2_171193_c0_seq1.p1 gnl/TRDRNA2_/TRDRNA2_171193_c0~~gnl/TRDRNA2_/TRDRNA2_171193_c0_seq1.p1  ORF type:complete len:581 (+),score=79.24 gnl/TRDRNA2_/TRDRNA2_171193_c0_seq1:150-1892(+)
MPALKQLSEMTEQDLLQAGSQKASEDADDVLRPLLEYACRETLKELARNSADPESGAAGTRTLDSIIQGVSARILAEAGQEVDLSGVLKRQQRKQAQKPPETPKPQLEDLQTTSWVIWRTGGRGPSVSATESRTAPSSPVLTRQIPNFRYQEAKARSTEVLKTTVSIEDASETSTAGEDDSLPEEEKFRVVSPGLTALEGVSLHETKTPTNAWAPPLESMISPPHRARLESSVTFSEPCIISDRPSVVRNGLTIDSNTACVGLMMQWQSRPHSALVIAKPGDADVLAAVQDIAAWLSSQGMVVVLEPQLLRDQPHLQRTLCNIRTFSSADQLEKAIDLVVTVGGDGTLAWAVSLFRGAMPPVLSFAAGSLGFLTPFPLDGWVRTLTKLLDLHGAREPVPLVCRMRLRVTVHRTGSQAGKVEAVECKQCLNEVLVHRGKSGALCKLDVSIDGEHVTLVQGDGLILATPTGSTAYSLAAGGSMVHPAVPAILMTPVSPHSLSFRPAVLPDSAVLTIGVPQSARGQAALSVDGKDCCTLFQGDTVEVSMSPHPLPTICRATETKDWFASVHEALQWNSRCQQK